MLLKSHYFISRAIVLALIFTDNVMSKLKNFSTVTDKSPSIELLGSKCQVLVLIP